MYSVIDVIIEKYKVNFASAIKILRDVAPKLETNKPLDAPKAKDLIIEAIRKESEEDRWY
jgi:hypothetical protein